MSEFMGLFKSDKPEIERHYARTTDGWDIALHRFPNPEALKHGRAPVFFCHGLGANRYNLDAPGKLSLARWFWRQGFESWVVELRGTGYSSRPRIRNDLSYDWNFDDYVEKDIPAALDMVSRVTGFPNVHWIGHSMGGMIAYAYLISRRTERIRSLCTIGSPSFSRLGNPILDRIVLLKPLVTLFKRIPYEGAGVLLIPSMPLFKETVGRLFGNPRNMKSRDLMRIIALAPTTLPTSLLSQLAGWYEEGGFKADGHGIDYCAGLDQVRRPTLVIAGAKDFLTPVEDLEFIFESLGSEEKRFLVLGRETGCRHDYGHIDPVLGRYAESEVWPQILDWVRNH